MSNKGIERRDGSLSPQEQVDGVITRVVRERTSLDNLAKAGLLREKGTALNALLAAVKLSSKEPRIYLELLYRKPQKMALLTPNL